MPSQFLPNRVYQFILMLLMSMLLGGVVMFVLGDYRDTMWGKTLLFVVLGVVFVGLVYWLNKRNGVELSGYYTCDLRYLWFTAGIVVVIEILIVIPFATLFSSPTEGVADVWLCIGAIFIGPLIEETMFRGGASSWIAYAIQCYKPFVVPLQETSSVAMLFCCQI